MKPTGHFISSLGRFCAVSWLLVVAATAAAVTPLEALVADSRAAMTAKQWEQALELNARAIELFGGADAIRDYGPQFGIIYYRKGLCEMKLGRWKEAMASFETCYRDFPNDGKADGNTYQKMALRKWAESAMGAGQWELAISNFAKFIAERDKQRDTFPQGSFYINLAVCHCKLGHLAEGSENLEIAIRNKANFPTPDLGIIAGFQALVSAVIVDGNEQALLDFIRKNRGALHIEPYELYQFSPVFMKLAGDALAVGMRRSAMELYQFIPSTDVAIDDVRARLRSMGNSAQLKSGAETLDRKALEKDLATFEADRRGKQSTEAIKLAAIAFLHEASGNFLGAYAAYLQLETYFSGSGQREENLFNLVRVASRVGLTTELRAQAAVFMRDFPDSAHLTEAKQLELSTFLDGADPAGCIAVAEPMLPTLAVGTPAHEICLYLLATATFRSGDHAKAQPLLDQLVKFYRQGSHAEEAAFLQAANASRLFQWEKAAAALDDFLTNYPDSPWTAEALQERGVCHFAQGQPDAARKLADRVISEFPTSPVTDQADQLLGDIEAAAGHPEAAEKAYLKAFEIASRQGDRELAGDALCALIELSDQGGSGKDDLARRKRALVHADRYWKEFAEGSPYQTRVAIAQVRAFVAAGRAAEAMDRLQGIVATGATAARGQRTLVDAYARAFLADHSAEELEGQFGKFPGIDAADKPLLARMQIAVIAGFEKQASTATDAARRQEAETRVRLLYQQLKTGFTPADLDTPALIRLADHLRLQTSAPREALVYYDEAVARNDPRWRTAALIGQGDLRGGSTDASEAALGLAALQEVFRNSPDASERGFALFRIMETRMDQGEFAKAADEAGAFLDSPAGKSCQFSSRLTLLLARCLQELKRPDEAISRYAQVWKNHRDQLQVSAPAMLGWVRLLATRDQTGDRQSACDTAMDYLAKTRSSTIGMKKEDLAPWLAIEEEVKSLTGNPRVPTPEKKPAPDEKDGRR